ncbi:MAG: FkbM family methyltransferase [Alphaproteobacteria bacterium]|nr:FkbM family methyltransferase [Alphaproteobacteria bacterium]
MSFDPSAIGSDVARDRRQYLMRRVAAGFVRLFGLDRATPLATEIVQAINPVARIETRHGPLLCKGGHGRLVWRAATYHSEEPQTIEWLDAMDETSVYWDVGSNVGLYAIHAAKFRKARVLALEPESQNFALLCENIALNGVGALCRPACLAVASRSGPGEIAVRYITKGGAYNQFSDGEAPYVPESAETAAAKGPVLRQMVYGVSLDDLVALWGETPPTHLKIDVDGLEPQIVAGARKLFDQPSLRTVLIEINRCSPRDREIPDILASHGFALRSERSNWLSRDNTQRQSEYDTTNMIFDRG